MSAKIAGVRAWYLFALLFGVFIGFEVERARSRGVHYG